MTKTVSIMDQTCSVLATQVDGAASVWDIACPRANFTSVGEGKVNIPQEGNQTAWRHLRWSLEDLSFPMWNTRESLVWFSGPGRRQHFWLWRSDGDTPIQRRLQDRQNTADECEIQTWLAERYKCHSWVIVWKRTQEKPLRYYPSFKLRTNFFLAFKKNKSHFSILFVCLKYNTYRINMKKWIYSLIIAKGTCATATQF